MNQKNTEPQNGGDTNPVSLIENEDPVAALIDCCVCMVEVPLIPSSTYHVRFRCSCNPHICVACFTNLHKCVYCQVEEFVSNRHDRLEYTIPTEQFERLLYSGIGLGLELNDGVVINALNLHHVCGEYRVYLYRQHVILNYRWEDALHLVELDNLYFHDWCNQMFNHGISMNPLIRVALNGNNGSWTNTDDVKTAKELDAERVRITRERKTLLHRTSNNDGGSSACANARKMGKIPKKDLQKSETDSSSESDSLSISLTDDSEVPSLPIEYYISSKCSPMVYDCTEKRILYPLPGMNLIPSDVYLTDIVESLPGKVSRQLGKGGCGITQAPFMRVNIPEYKYVLDGVTHYQKHINTVIFVPLFQDIKRTMKNIDPYKNFDRVYHTMLCLSQTYELTTELISDTLRYCIAHGSKMNLRKRNVVNALLTHDIHTFISSDDGVLDNRPGVITTGALVRDIAKVCELPNTYTIRDDIVIPPEFNKIKNEFKRYLGFADDADYVEKEYDTQYFGLHPENIKNFQSYGKHPSNLTLGLQRIVGARENENDYAHMQRSLLGKFLSTKDQDLYYNTREFHHYRKIRKTLKIGINTTTKMLFLGSSGNSDKEQVHLYGDRYEEVFKNLKLIGDPHLLVEHTHNKLTKQIDHLVAKCDRSGMIQFLDKLENIKNWSYGSILLDYHYLCSAFELRDNAAQIAHVKKVLRTHYVANLEVHTDNDIMMERLELKVKRELAKPGKAPRIFASYGAGCMSSPELPEFVKTCIDGDYHLDGKVITKIKILAKPKPDSLKEIFEDCMLHTGIRDTLYVAIYSDDSVVCGNIKGKPIAFNLDISSCDMSNSHLIFTIVGKMLSQFNCDRAQALLRQCMQTMHIVNPNDKNDKKFINMFRPFEGSGTVLTTILNHVASYIMACNIHNVINLLYDSINSDDDIFNAVITACASVGYKITCENCKINDLVVFEKIQFLKYSPMFTESGEMVPTLNYGPVLRSLGRVRQSLRPEQLGVTHFHFSQMSDTERMDRFFSAVIKGHCHAPDSIIFEALRERFNYQTPSNDVVPSASLDFQNTYFQDLFDYDNSSRRISMLSICNRYDCDEVDVLSFVDNLRSLSLGDHVYSPFLNCVYGVDYGLK